MEHRRLGLALSGGSLRGLAHVGLLQVLDREGIHVHCIAGTSAGAAVGAAYAAGLRGDRLVQQALSLRWRYVARPAWSRAGLFTFARAESYFSHVVGDLTFAELHIPFAAVAVDLETGEQVILREGRVAQAVRASGSVPALITPVQWNGRRLVDGGVVNNLPISVVRDLGADVVVAVMLGDLQAWRPRSPLGMLLWSFERMLEAAGDDPATADLVIRVPLSGWGSLLANSGGRRALALGRSAGQQALPAIRALLSR